MVHWYNWWTYTDTWLIYDEPTMTHDIIYSLHGGSLLVVCILWVWTNIQWHISLFIVSYRVVSLLWKSSVFCLCIPPFFFPELAFLLMSDQWLLMVQTSSYLPMCQGSISWLIFLTTSESLSTRPLVTSTPVTILFLFEPLLEWCLPPLWDSELPEGRDPVSSYFISLAPSSLPGT